MKVTEITPLEHNIYRTINSNTENIRLWSNKGVLLDPGLIIIFFPKNFLWIFFHVPAQESAPWLESGRGHGASILKHLHLMKRIAFVLATVEFTSKSGKELTILKTTSEDIILNTKFAKVNGIDSSFASTVLVEEELCKAGETWVNEETGESGEYSKDFSKVNSIMPLKGDMFQKKYEDAVASFLGI